MPVTKVKSKWVDGNLVFTDHAGKEIVKLDSATAAVVAAGQHASTVVYAKTSAGAVDVAPASHRARSCIAIARVTEVFANGTGAQPTFKLGDQTSDASVFKTAQFTNAALNAVIVGAGPIAATEKVVLTATAATGNGTGAIELTVITL